MSFRITGLAPDTFASLRGADEATLASAGARRIRVDGPGFPERIGLRDAAPGETVLLVNHVSVPDGPYRASHGIYVSETEDSPWDRADEIPPALATRLLSLRAFGADWSLLGFEVVHGTEAAPALERLLADEQVAEVHAHNAGPGCFAARVTRA